MSDSSSEAHHPHTDATTRPHGPPGAAQKSHDLRQPDAGEGDTRAQPWPRSPGQTEPQIPLQFLHHCLHSDPSWDGGLRFPLWNATLCPVPFNSSRGRSEQGQVARGSAWLTSRPLLRRMRRHTEDSRAGPSVGLHHAHRHRHGHHHVSSGRKGRHKNQTMGCYNYISGGRPDLSQGKVATKEHLSPNLTPPAPSRCKQVTENTRCLGLGTLCR